MTADSSWHSQYAESSYIRMVYRSILTEAGDIIIFSHLVNRYRFIKLYQGKPAKVKVCFCYEVQSSTVLAADNFKRDNHFVECLK
jgi:hypothetical protein